jgi:lipoprotein signal peptidase
MTGQARQDTLPAANPPLSAERKDRLRERSMVLALLAAVIVLDQAAKWLAWRYVSGVEINPGGDVLVGRTVGRWYADPVRGALLDLLDFGMLSAAVSVLMRRRRPALVIVPGALMIGGWSSNLLDRLGMHYWTAPGSVRGAVDFIHIGGYSWNVADFFIVGATPLFLLAAAHRVTRVAGRAATAATMTPPPRKGRRARSPISVLAGVGLIVAVALNAAHYRGVSAAPPHVSAKCSQHALQPACAPNRGPVELH